MLRAVWQLRLGDHQIVGALVEELDRLWSVVGFVNRDEPQIPQQATDALPRESIVVNDENASVRSFHGASGLRIEV